MGSKADIRTDIAIIGGGIAGITFALELLEADDKRQITIIDRRSEAEFGGQALLAFGGMMLIDSPYQRRSGIKDSPDLALKDWLSRANFEPEDQWPRAWAEYYVNNVTARVHDWLRARGISFLPAVQWVERGLFTPGNSVPRYHIMSGTSQYLTKKLIEALRPAIEEGRLKCLFEHSAEDFILEQGKLTGIEVTNVADNRPLALHADTIVIATGGISGSIEQVKKHWRKDWGKPPQKILNGCFPANDGTMHEKTRTIGGEVSHLDWAWNYAAGIDHPQPEFEGHGLSLVPTRSSLWMDHTGQRIGPLPLITGFDTNYLCRRVAEQEKPWTWHIMNRKIARRELAISGAKHNPLILKRKYISFLISLILGDDWLLDKMIRESEDFIVADSFSELTEKMNALTGENHVSEEILGRSISDYDAILDRPEKQHNDDQIRRLAHLRQWLGDKIRTCKFQKISDQKALPYVAIRTHLISRKTLGGIQTNLDCQVLDKNGQPIDNLFAIGEAAGFGGGGSNGKSSLEGTFLSSCILTARRAADIIRENF